MYKEMTAQRKRFNGKRAQAMVEFAIAMPVLLLMLYGLMEFGRMVFIYSLVNTASRDAVRYASAYGYSDDGYLKYRYCAGIRAVAKQAAYIVPLVNSNITITYDSGPNTSSLFVNGCNNDNPNAAGEDTRVGNINSGTRVTVTVQATYTPLIGFLKLTPKALSSTNSRTILGVLSLNTYP